MYSSTVSPRNFHFFALNIYIYNPTGIYCIVYCEGVVKFHYFKYLHLFNSPIYWKYFLFSTALKCQFCHLKKDSSVCEISLSNIFSHFSLSFYTLNRVFYRAKLFFKMLIKFILSIFPFENRTFCVKHKNFLPSTRF